jgi:membrane fusion protein, copper/silver efflux system
MKFPTIPPSLRRIPRKLLALLLPITLFLFGWWFGLPASEKSGDGSAAANGEVWTCSMHPQIRQPAFGLCPICNMDLIPLEADGGGGGLRELSVSPEASALLDLRVSPATRAPVENQIRLFGRIAYDERRISTITSRVAGRLDRLFVDFTGAIVSEGDHLAEIYSPDLLVAQRELIEARRAIDALPSNSSEVVRDTRQRLLQAAREKLRLLQFSEERIQSIERSRAPTDQITLDAPQAGVVIEKMANQGDYVETGTPLFRIADLSGVWVNLEAYENDLQWLRYAQDVHFEVEAIPGRNFTGRIVFIDPQIDPERRVARVRVNVANEDRTLKPGMFVRATVRSTAAVDGRVLDPSLAGKWISPMHPEIIKDAPGQCDICGMDLVPAEEFGFVGELPEQQFPLLVPASAVLQTGPRAIVYVRLPDRELPTFEGREVVLGSRVGDQFIIASGLSDGEVVVTQGAFKLDSELQIKAKPSMMSPDAGLSEKPAHSAPESLAGQWPAVPRALHRFMEDPSAERMGLLRDLILAINPEQLQPDELALWNEFSRRLLNDLEVASQVLATQPDQAAAQLARAVEQAGRFLGLPFQPDATPTVDPVIAAALRKLISSYLPLAKALADDDDTAASRAASDLLITSESVQVPALADLIEMIRTVVAAADLKSRRTAFEPLSNRLIELVRAQGIDAVGNAYVVHCPMAFGNQGADWLSSTPVVLNPYFGDAMLTCGTVTDTLSIDRHSPPPEAPPAKIPPATPPRKQTAPQAPVDPHAGH